MSFDDAAVRSASQTRAAAMIQAARRSPDLLMLILLGLAMPVLHEMPISIVRVPLGLLLTLFAPGYVVTVVTFPARDVFDPPARAAVSLGLSVALIPAFALALSTSPDGLRSSVIALAVGLWIVVLSIAGIYRRERTGSHPAVTVPSVRMPVLPLSGAGSRTRKGVVILAIVGGVALVSGLAPLVNRDSPQSTAFYMLGSEQQIAWYPHESIAGDSVSVVLGVANGSVDKSTFRIEVWVSPDVTRRGAAYLAESTEWFEVPDGHEKTLPVKWVAEQPGDGQHVELLLFQGAQQAPIRRLSFIMDISPAAQWERPDPLLPSGIHQRWF